MTKLWIKHCYSINKFKCLEIFPEISMCALIFQGISLSFPSFPWFFNFFNFCLIFWVFLECCEPCYTVINNRRSRPEVLLKEAFSCEFCNFFKNTVFIEHLQWVLVTLYRWETSFNFVKSFQQNVASTLPVDCRSTSMSWQNGWMINDWSMFWKIYHIHGDKLRTKWHNIEFCV